MDPEEEIDSRCVLIGLHCPHHDDNTTVGYFRLALAQKNLKRYDAALETIKLGQKIDLGE